MGLLTTAANYKEVDPHGAVTIGNTETDLPAVSAGSVMKYPEKIFIQACPSNTESIFIGPTGVKIDGTLVVLELPQGSSAFLPSHLLSYWKMICASGASKAYITYYRGVF